MKENLKSRNFATHKRPPKPVLTEPEGPRISFYPYQKEAFHNKTNGTEGWLWGRQTGKSFTLAAWADHFWSLALAIYAAKDAPAARLSSDWQPRRFASVYTGVSI